MNEEFKIPMSFQDSAALEEFMSRPDKCLRSDLDKLDGDIIIIGASGKMGVTLARLAKRAAPKKRVTAVARFSDNLSKQRLEAWGIETIVCDVLDQEAVNRLPKAKNVIFLVGRKFGMPGDESLTWAMNTITSANVANAFSDSRIVTLSTGCVYAFVDVKGAGSTEGDLLRPPPSDYTMSCIGRERIFEYYGSKFNTPGRIIRLNYAIDMRYGVLHDIAMAVYNKNTLNISTGYVNVIWQGDANCQILRSLLHCSPKYLPLNVSGLQKVSIRETAAKFGQIFNKEVITVGEEKSTAWLTNTKEAGRLFGPPKVSLEQMIEWTADWISSGKQTYNKATKYDVRSGSF